MSNEIRAGSFSEAISESVSSRRLVPMKIGNATVYVEQAGEPVTIEGDDSIRPVRPRDLLIKDFT